MAETDYIRFIFSRMHPEHDTTLYFPVNKLGYPYSNHHLTLSVQDCGLPF